MPEISVEKIRSYARFVEVRARGAQEELYSITPLTPPETWSAGVRDIREPVIREMTTYRAVLSELYERFPGARPRTSVLDSDTV